MQNAFRILKPIQKVRNAFDCFVTQVQTRLAYEDKRDLYCKLVFNILAAMIYVGPKDLYPKIFANIL